jgi:hypothetical protein
MRLRVIAKRLLGSLTILIWTGCSMGSQPAVGPPAAVQDTARTGGAPGLGVSPLRSGSGLQTANVNRSKSWMRPGARSDLTLLYIANQGTADVTVYQYDNGTPALEGTLTGFVMPAGECTDRAHVFIVDEIGKIYQYRHGGKQPVATLDDQYGQPYGCSVDPNSGDLAVTNVAGASGPGNVVIYPKGSGNPVEYSDSNLSYPFFCGYDFNGNLYVDGQDNGHEFAFAELAKGSGALTPLRFQKRTLRIPGSIQSIGPNVLVGDQNFKGEGTSAVYRMTVVNFQPKIEGVVLLSGTQDVPQFWERGTQSNAKIVAPDLATSNVQVYTFPDGSLFSTLTNGISNPFAAVVSRLDTKGKKPNP